MKTKERIRSGFAKISKLPLWLEARKIIEQPEEELTFDNDNLPSFRNSSVNVDFCIHPSRNVSFNLNRKRLFS